MKINLVKNSKGQLTPAFNSDLEKFKKIVVGGVIQCTVRLKRNTLFHAKFFGLLNLAFQNQEVFDSFDIFREEMMKASGHYTRYINHKGNTCYKAKSIAFDNMTEDKFQEVYKSVGNKLIEIFDFKESIYNEIEDYM